MNATENTGDALERTLADIVRVSRELGADPSLVLHGGGNTSAKARSVDATGAEVELVLVKGSGWDLATIEAAGFAPLRRERILPLLDLDALDDEQMVNELRQASLDAGAPTASIEGLLHARIPARFVLHSHSDAIVALTNQRHGAAAIEQALGERVLTLPYVKPGFPLARQIARTELGGADAIVLSNHGLFTFADDADVALERHRELVRRAERSLGAEAGSWGDPGRIIVRGGDPAAIAALRTRVSEAAGRPMLLRQSESSLALDRARRDDLAAVLGRGTATPEHVIHTKRTPLVGRDVQAFVDGYRRYFAEHRHRAPAATELDPAPRVVYDAEFGLLTAGRTLSAVRAAYDIAMHTADIVEAADRGSGYRSLGEGEAFDIEYWSLEQAKLGRGVRPPLEGEVAVVTGAASGIGRAVAAALLSAGAVVVGLDLDPDVGRTFSDGNWRGLTGDASDGALLEEAFASTVRDFGGIDVLVTAAGIFPESAPLAAFDDETWERSLLVNATAVARAFRAAHRYLRLSPRGGRAVHVSTKNVGAPGPGAAAYSASKSAAAQLARVAALEWAADGIRVNQVEPDAVFDTGIWTDELLRDRAARYGLSVEEYRSRNLLRTEVTSAAVAEAVLAFCTGLEATTGAHLSVDGGNERVI